MASQKAAQRFQWLARRPRWAGHDVVLPFKQGPNGRRTMATVSDVPVEQVVQQAEGRSTEPSSTQLSSTLTTTVTPSDLNESLTQPPHTVLTTVHHFPTMEPQRFAYYPSNHLALPLRRDILHRAIVYEGDKTRQGTHSTKWRSEVHGSHAKVLPQKGTGRARAGDKQSPIRRGGGVAHGPKPRDHSTKLNRKIYDLAWRTALSHRWRIGELFVVDRMRNPKTAAPYYMKQIFEANGWGNENGRSLLVASEYHQDNRKFFDGVERIGEHGRILTADDVDCKNLLEMGRVIIEFEALNSILMRHSSDIVKAPTLLGRMYEEPDVESAIAS